MSTPRTHPTSPLLKRPARIALLGCGTVGSAVARRLLDAGPSLGTRLVKVLVRHPARDRALPSSLFTDSYGEVVSARPDVIVELIGGLHPASAYVEDALGRGIPVVTANKTLMAHHGERLERMAAGAGATLAHEASVCAAIPILAALRQLAGDRVLSIRAIVNGTCNFILSRMAAAGLGLDDALAEAKRRGFAEPDPSADLSGRDSAEKLCLLAAAAGHRGVSPGQVACTGIERLTLADIGAARRSGRVIKLLAELNAGPDGPRLRVGPTLIPVRHPLAGVADEHNAVQVTTELAGDLFLSGKGAGPAPTTSAVLGDVVRVLGRPHRQGPSRATGTAPSAPTPARHHIRVRGAGFTPDLVLSTLRARGAEAEEVELGRSGVSVTARVTHDQAEACGRTIAAGGEVLVMPVLSE